MSWWLVSIHMGARPPLPDRHLFVFFITSLSPTVAMWPPLLFSPASAYSSAVSGDGGFKPCDVFHNSGPSESVRLPSLASCLWLPFAPLVPRDIFVAADMRHREMCIAATSCRCKWVAISMTPIAHLMQANSFYPPGLRWRLVAGRAAQKRGMHKLPNTHA